MSDVGPSKAAVNATVRFAAAPRENTPDAEDVQFLKDLLTETPTRRTPVHRWKAGKRKVIALIGSASCILWGFVDPTVLHLIHIVPRTLWRSHPELFLLLQEAVGKVVTTPYGEERVLFLDCTGNCDLMNCFSHKLFDGTSVEKALGSGSFFLLPVELDKSLEIIVKAKGTKQSYIDMFPEHKTEYVVVHLSSCQPMQVPCWGPEQRTYEHLDSLLPPKTQASNVEDHVDLLEPGDKTAGDEEDPRVITPDDIPKGCRQRPTFPPGYTPPVRWLPGDGPRHVVSHTNPVFHLFIATYMLHMRHSGEIPGGLSESEVHLYYKLWNSLSHFYKAETPELRARLDKAMNNRLFEGSTRRSRRLLAQKKNKTAPVRKSKRLAAIKRRKAVTEPAFDTAPATSSSSTTAADSAFSFRYELRSRRQSDANSAAAPPSRYDLRSRTMTDASPAAPIAPAKRAATSEVPAGADRKTKKRKTG
ncbi:hypothetical protein GGG16DRAFT_105471 [Schizophyllum commune]